LVPSGNIKSNLRDFVSRSSATMSTPPSQIPQRRQEKALPLQPLRPFGQGRPIRAARIELENSQSREGLVLENAKLREKNEAMETEIEILYTQVSQYSEVLEKYKGYEDDATKSMARISRTIKSGMAMHVNAVSEMEKLQVDVNNDWEEFVQMKRSVGISVEQIIKEIRERVILRRSSDIYMDLELNMIGERDF
jgi:hypothetical protein